MTNEIPPEITEAARLIEGWFLCQDIHIWQLRGICSRNHADIALKLSTYVRHEPRCMKMEGPTSCNCGLNELLELLK